MSNNRKPHPSPLKRASWFRWYEQHGLNAAATCRHFGISRSTFYHWLPAHRDNKLRESLGEKKRSLRSHHPGRKPVHRNPALVRKISNLDAHHNGTLGRVRIQAMLIQAGFSMSQATVGRILSTIRKRCPVCNSRGRHLGPLHVLEADLDYFNRRQDGR